MKQKWRDTVQADELMVARAKRGDSAAFEALVAPFERRIYLTCLKLMGNEQDAGDCAQEALLRAYRAMASYRSEARLETWLYRIAYNICLDALRRRKRIKAESLEALSENGFAPEDKGQTPYSALEQKERIAALKKGLDKLPEDMRTVLLLSQVEDMGYDEIAEITNTPVGTVKSRINRARLKLKEILMEHAELFSSVTVQRNERRANN
jgi:RNA polymerase sigma-70 factor (ECF subfamily)